ncbi:hypothetical protein [Streptomyces sp. UG1]|uniref:hypothetical protein n=1 Tax=Streptomyces sp. UG1 TaxID=3417652 RepID=UPI003CE6F5C1
MIRAANRPCTPVVCLGCCCGNPRKHPGTDHAWQLDRLRAAAEHGFKVRTTDCLGPCDQANVIVVQPSTAGRRVGGRATWIGFAVPFVGGGIAFTITAVRMTNALNSKAEAKRREVLGEL